MGHDARYNGYANYETWRVRLEVFDGLDLEEFGFDAETDLYELGKWCEEYAEEAVFSGHVDERRPTSLMEDYARSFLSNVDWREIAESLVEEIAA